jgi:hypothetical protein
MRASSQIEADCIAAGCSSKRGHRKNWEERSSWLAKKKNKKKGNNSNSNQSRPASWVAASVAFSV